LPPELFVAGQFGHLGEVVAEAGIPGFEEGQEFVPDAVAGEGGVAVGGVFAPRLADLIQVGFDFGAGCGEERAEDAAFGELDDRVNSGETFGPGAAEELGADGFGLVIAGVGGGDGMERNF